MSVYPVLTTEELLYSYSRVGLRMSDPPRKLSARAASRVIEALSPAAEPPKRLGLSALAASLFGERKDKAPEPPEEAPDLADTMLAAEFSPEAGARDFAAIVAYHLLGNEDNLPHFAVAAAVEPLLEICAEGQPFGKFYAALALSRLLDGPASIAAGVSDLLWGRQVIGCIVGTADDLELGWQIDAFAFLLWKLFVVTTDGKFGYRTHDVDIMSSYSHDFVTERTAVTADSALSLLIYLCQRLHGCLSDMYGSQVAESPEEVGGAATARGRRGLDASRHLATVPSIFCNSMMVIAKAIAACLRLPIFRAQAREARVLTSVAAILSAQDATDTFAEGETIYALLQAAAACMVPLQAVGPSALAGELEDSLIRTTVRVEGDDVPALLTLDFFGILSRLAYTSPDALLVEEAVRCLSFAAANGLYRVNCLHALADGANSVPPLDICRRILEESGLSSDMQLVIHMFEFLSGACHDRAFRASLRSDQALLQRISALVRDVLAGLRPRDGERRRGLRSRRASAAPGASQGAGAEHAQDAQGQDGPGAADAVDAAPGAPELASTATGLAATARLGATGFLASGVNPGAAGADGEADLEPLSLAYAALYAYADMSRVMSVDYGRLVDFHEVDFYNAHESQELALGAEGRALLETILPVLIELAEFLRPSVLSGEGELPGAASVISPLSGRTGRALAEAGAVDGVSAALPLSAGVIFDCVLGGIYQIVQLNIPLMPFVSSQTDVNLLRNKFRNCGRSRIPALSELELRVLQLLLLDSSRPRTCALALFAINLERELESAAAVLDSTVTVASVEHALRLMQHSRSLEKSLCASTLLGASSADALQAERIIAEVPAAQQRRAVAGHRLDLVLEAARLFSSLIAASETQALVTSRAMGCLMQGWYLLSRGAPDESEASFSYIAAALRHIPPRKRSQYAAQVGNESIERLMRGVWGLGEEKD